MNLFQLKMVSAAFILLIAIIGGAIPFFKKRWDFPAGEALATGIFLGAGLLHMLPDASAAFNAADYHYPIAFLIAAIGFLLLLSLEHISQSIVANGRQKNLALLAMMSTMMLSIHALLEGTAAGMAIHFTTAILILVAIIAHKGAAGFALSIQLNRSHLGFPARIIAFSVFAVMTPIGVVAGNSAIYFTHNLPLLVPICNALAAGTFIYLGTLHGMGEASLIYHCKNIKGFFTMLLGFIVMAIVAVWT